MKIKEDKIKYNNGKRYHIGIYSITNIMPHFHSKELELVFCLDGHVNLIAGHQRVRINSGELFSVDYRDIHYIYSDVPNKTILFHLDLTRLEVPWEQLAPVLFACESSHCFPYQEKAMSDIKDILLTFAYDNYTQGSRCDELPDTLIEILLEYFNWFNYENQTKHMNNDLYERFYRIVSYCNENYSRKITISQLAESEHINKNYFSQFIRRTVFHSFSNMIKYIRCYEAEQLLLNTDMPVSEISYACGFSDNKYFYAAFNKWWGTTPSKHRAKYAEYMKKPEKITAADSRRAKEFLSEYITEWHIEKTLKL